MENTRVVEVVLTDDGIFYEHEGEMLPVPCQWFALCENVATSTRSHPVIGDVPICARCDAKVNAL